MDNDGFNYADLFLCRQSVLLLEAGGAIIESSFFDMNLSIFIDDNEVWNGHMDGDIFGPKRFFSSMLPLKLLSFSSISTQSGYALEWVVLDDIDAVGFEVEVSIDGLNFNFAGFYPSTQNTGTSEFHTQFPSSSTSRYARLKILHSNGESFYSEIIKVNQSLTNEITTNNPFKDCLKINLPRCQPIS